MGSQLEIADDKLRAAMDRLAERERLTKVRDALQPDLDEAEKDVAAWTDVHAKEQKDVQRYERGVWAFLYDVFADREGRLTREQKEAAMAEIKLVEVTVLRDRLRGEVATLSSRITELANAEAELEVARAGKQAVLIASKSPIAKQLADVGEELGKLQRTGRELEEALDAGARAHSTLTRLAEVLGSARNWGAWDMFSDSMLISWQKRHKIDQARDLAGIAQAEITVFSRELRDLGIGLRAELSVLADHHRFLDVWFDNIFSDWSVQDGIKRAQESTDQALLTIGAQLAQLRGSLEEVIAKGRELSKHRRELLA